MCVGGSGGGGQVAWGGRLGCVRSWVTCGPGAARPGRRSARWSGPGRGARPRPGRAGPPATSACAAADAASRSARGRRCAWVGWAVRTRCIGVGWGWGRSAGGGGAGAGAPAGRGGGGPAPDRLLGRGCGRGAARRPRVPLGRRRRRRRRAAGRDARGGAARRRRGPRARAGEGRRTHARTLTRTGKHAHAHVPEWVGPPATRVAKGRPGILPTPPALITVLAPRPPQACRGAAGGSGGVVVSAAWVMESWAAGRLLPAGEFRP